MTPESKGFTSSGNETSFASCTLSGSAVTVCGERLALRQSTTSPLSIVTLSGSNVKSGVMVMVTAGLAAAASGLPAGCGLPPGSSTTSGEPTGVAAGDGAGVAAAPTGVARVPARVGGGVGGSGWGHDGGGG